MSIDNHLTARSKRMLATRAVMIQLAKVKQQTRKSSRTEFLQANALMPPFRDHMFNVDIKAAEINIRNKTGLSYAIY